MDVATTQDVLDFWFKELSPQNWWEKNASLDNTIAERFKSTLKAVQENRLSSWRKTPEGSLAEIIVLDQFSRNIYRNQKKAFANDAQALLLAKEAIAKGYDKKLSFIERKFMYMPFMHSESLAEHKTAIELFSIPGLEESLEYEKQHQAIIERFGRYPHRNAILGRKSTDEEIKFLKQPGSSF